MDEVCRAFAVQLVVYGSIVTPIGWVLRRSKGLPLSVHVLSDIHEQAFTLGLPDFHKIRTSHAQVVEHVGTATCQLCTVELLGRLHHPRVPRSASYQPLFAFMERIDATGI